MLDELTSSESAVARARKKRRLRRIIVSLVSLLVLVAVGTGAAYVVRSKDVSFIIAPFTGFGVSPTGASIDIVDDAQMAQLSFALKSDDMGSYPTGQQTQ